MVEVVGVRMSHPPGRSYAEVCAVVGRWLATLGLEARMWDANGAVCLEFSRPVDRDRLRHSAPWMPMSWISVPWTPVPAPRPASPAR